MAKECTAVIKSSRDIAGSYQALKMVLENLGLIIEADNNSGSWFCVIAKRVVSLTKNAWAQTATFKSQIVGQDVFVNISVLGKEVGVDQNSKKLLDEIVSNLQIYSGGTGSRPERHDESPPVQHIMDSPLPIVSSQLSPKKQIKPKKPVYKRVWFWVLIVFIGIPVLVNIVTWKEISRYMRKRHDKSNVRRAHV